MFFDAVMFWEWISLALRWLHILVAMAWIGSSFYFIAMDLGLRKHPNLPKGAYGEEWQVHGGGFYHIQKYLVAPETMPEHLTWFKWESYLTWISGAALLAVVYYLGADLYLIDRSVWDVEPWQGILMSMFLLAMGWVVYDLLCRSVFARNTNALMIVLFIILVIFAWLFTLFFSARAAYLHLGAFTATIMTANVFFIIIPNQKKVVASLIAGKSPDPQLGVQAKQRSTHNNYLTLPVVFLMISNHYPLAYTSQLNWLIAALLFLLGVVIRVFFNTRDARKGNLWWLWGVAVLLFCAMMALSFVGRGSLETTSGQAQTLEPTAQQQALMNNPHYEAVREMMGTRCSMCHAQSPLWEGISVAPKAVVLETDQQITKLAREIYLFAGATNAMPPSNITYMEQEERQLIVAWYKSAALGQE